MAECATRYGSGIERVLAEGIGVLISAEKLRGTDLDLGEIGATARPHSPYTPLRVLVGWNLAQLGCSLWGPHAVHG